MDKTLKVTAKQLRIADVFCGIGSMTMVGEELGMRCVFACDNDAHVKKAYQAQYGVLPDGDIKEVKPETVPDHDILCAGFPCQPFSRMGNKRGTNEDRGRIMDYAIDILRVKRPRAFILENVRGLLSSNGGEDFKRLEDMIKSAGYSFQHQMLRCEDFGIPQTRHRIFMVGFRDGHPPGFQYPKPLGKCPSLSEFLGMEVVKPMSNTVRCSGRKSGVDNAKNWSAYRLKDGTVFEYNLEHVTKLQGFPLDFNWGGAPESQRWKMLGNTIPTCLSRAILTSVAKHLEAFPEKPAEIISACAHPPPARKIIEKRLSQCEKDTVDRKKKKSKGEEEEEEEDDDDEEESESEAEAEKPPVSRKRPASQAPAKNNVEKSAPKRPPAKKRPDVVVQKKKREEEDEEEEEDSDDEESPKPVTKKPRLDAPPPPPALTNPSTLAVPPAPKTVPTALPPRTPAEVHAPGVITNNFVMQLTIKSGTQMTLSIPDGILEQQYLLRIIK
jgi:DNA (cytosine-5)-methyltransferase 1